MARTDDVKVKGIIETEKSDLSPFITAANLTINEQIPVADVSDDLLTEIETWLAAHYLTAHSPRTKKEQIGPTRVTYEGQTGEGLKGSRYGQKAITLDPTGELGGSSKPNIDVKFSGP